VVMGWYSLIFIVVSTNIWMFLLRIHFQETCKMA
jgi:hypothetical protein